MDMPTPCTECTEIFELNEGRQGLTHDTCETTICDNCHGLQLATKNRVDAIRKELTEKEDTEEAVNDYNNQIIELKQQKDFSEEDLLGIVERLEELKFEGGSDEYHNDVEKFY